MSEIHEERVFEVKVGVGASQANIEKLAAFATELGLFLTERPKEEVVGVDTFCDLAIQMWGDPAYGMFAEGMLESVRSSAKNMGVEVDEGGLAYVTANAFGMHKGNAAIGDIGLGKQTIYNLAHEAMANKGRSPFGFALTETASTKPLFKITPTVVTKGRLASFLGARFLDQHTLHGAQGKALDILIRAAGLDADVDEQAPREWEGELIDRKQLSALLTHYRFGRPQISCLLQGIDVKLMDQQRSGRPQCDYEMVVEVDSRLRQERPATTEWDAIALDSLASMGNAGHYSKQGRSNEKDRMNDTLANIHEHFYEWKMV